MARRTSKPPVHSLVAKQHSTGAAKAQEAKPLHRCADFAGRFANACTQVREM
jgi:hypothetical protein